MDKQEIVFVHLSSHTGGIEVLIPQLIRNIPGYSWSAFVVRPPIPGKPRVYDGVDVRLTYGSARSLAAVWKLFMYSVRRRKSIYHVFNIGPVFLFVLRMAGVRKLIYSIHGTIYWDTPGQKLWRRLLWRLSMHKKYVLTANSSFSRSVFARDVLPGKEIKVIYNPIDNKRFRPSESKKRHSRPEKIIYCGRLDNGKNLDLWVKTALAIKKEMPEAIFEIYGDGSEVEVIKKTIDIYGAGDSIILKGYIQAPEEAYRNADLMMFLSGYESFGNVVVESILCGTPVIAGDIPSMREIFCDFPEFIVDLDNKTAESVLKKIRHLDELIRLTAKARENFITRFDPAVHYRETEAIYTGFSGEIASGNV